MTLELTEQEAQELADMIEFYFFAVIRDDDSIDNIKWAKNLLRIHSLLEKEVTE